MTAREHGNVGRALQMRPNTLLSMFERCDAFRKPQRFADMLKASECDCFGRSGLPIIHFPQPRFLLGALEAAQAVNAGAVAQNYLGQAAKIAEAIRVARIDAIRHWREDNVTSFNV